MHFGQTLFLNKFSNKNKEKKNVWTFFLPIVSKIILMQLAQYEPSFYKILS